MADTIIGGANLGTSPVSTVEDEFFRTADGEIIGGVRKVSISGSIVGPDGASIMTQLKNIRELGARAECIDIETTAYKGKARIDNVTIPQGPDPAWINQGEFSIELTAQMDKIPPNRFHFTAADNVREFSQSESLSLGDESHGYAFTLKSKLKLSKTFVKWDTKMSIKCEPFCGSDVSGGGRKVLDILDSLVYGGPTDKVFEEDQYKSWSKYLGSRSLDISSDGVVSFSASIILVDTVSGCAPLLALVDIDFTTSDTYAAPKSETHTISGSIQGLCGSGGISWEDLVKLDSACLNNKVSNAISVFNQMASIITLHNGTFLPNYLSLKLEEQPNCPLPSPTAAACTNTNPNNIPGLIRPTTSSVSVNRITGNLTFSISWASADTADSCKGTDGATENISVNITPATEQFAQHVIPRYGTIMQRLNSFKSERVNFTYSKNGAAAFGLCDPAPLPDRCNDSGSFNGSIKDYFKNNPKKYLRIGYSKTWTNTSYSEQQDYIEICPNY